MSEGRNSRESERVSADYLVEYRVPDTGAEGKGQIRDLSQTGVRFGADQAIEPGAAISLRIPSETGTRPPLMVAAEVVRCLSEGDDAFDIACAFD